MKVRPKLDFRQAHYYSIYQAIASSRPVGMAGGLPIPVSEILSYCTLFKVDQLHERDRIFKIVRLLDGVYLKFVAKQSKGKSSK